MIMIPASSVGLEELFQFHEEICQQYDLHDSQGSACLIAPLEMQNLSDQLSNNILLLRGVGSLSDRWDRYCALRQTGKATYVRSRNWLTTGLDRFGEGSKAGTANSDFLASALKNGPLTAPKISIFPPKRQH